MSEISHRRPTNSLAAHGAAAIAILVCLFGQLGAIGLVGPDEPRYAWIARAMSETGDWITPRLYGQPWFEKPALYYWAAAVGFRLHLSAEWAARLPSAFAALAASLAIGWLALKHYDRDASSLSNPALLAPLLFSSSVAAIGFARAATPDMLFSASIALAMASAACVLRIAGALRSAEGGPRESPPDLIPLALFGVFLGFAVMAKGPAGVVLAGGAIGLWALVTKQWRTAFRFAHPFAIAAFCIVALPWYILCALRNPDFLHVFLFQHNFERYLTPMFQHRQPFWYFGPIVLVALLPWTVLLWPSAQEGLRLWREKSWKDSPGLFFACWAIIPVVFFSFSQSKLPGYILPAIPPLALLCSVSLTRALRTQPTQDRTSIAALGIAAGLTWIALGVSSALWIGRLPQEVHAASGWAIGMSAIFAMAGGIAIGVLGVLRRREFVLVALLLTVVLIEITNLKILPIIDPEISARPHAALLARDLHPDRIFTFELPRSWDYGLSFYLGRELPEWSTANPDSALVLTTPRGLEEMRKLGRFTGTLDEEYKGILLVPAFPAPRQR